MNADIVGWISSLVLVSTISRQVYTQWRTKRVEGVSKWLFIGQLTASFGFTIYSYLVDNWVFVFTNFFMFLTAVAGECIYISNKRHAQRQQSGQGESQKTSPPTASASGG
ncbi:PQ-loop repeat-containing protein [Noviherbaspirillum saxi]|uniref:PQ-loop repeat-containing protein n=1 Tax=Noviherbaspirillum saxi TaxID=2320863 RepID=A0A3A3GAA3_9BURK|nr:PQ-loop repeat-containing protein [Noviherbaspirillum saxi]RJF99095.1 PQ-loop repeat-containing protein [Noviherbaspirillum saxi]